MYFLLIFNNNNNFIRLDKNKKMIQICNSCKILKYDLKYDLLDLLFIIY